MLEHVQKQYVQLVSDLDELDITHNPDLFLPDQRLVLIAGVMDNLKEILSDFEFSSEEDEIRFFKMVLPPILSLQIYYTEKSWLETSDLIGTRKSRAEHRTRLLKKIDDFSMENDELYEYCSARKMNLDAWYFLRSSPLNQDVVLPGSVIDPKLYPVYSIKVATMTAYRKLEVILCEEQAEVVRPSAVSRLNWTGSKTALTELLYPLQKYVNNGQSTMKEIVHGFQHLLNTDLGNFPRTFQEVLERKKGDAHFLNQLANDLQQRIDDNEKERLRKRGFK